MSSSRPYTITVDTDNPYILDEIAKCPGNWEATMQQHHPVTNAVVEVWRRSHEERGGSLSDPTDVQMRVVEEPKPQEEQGSHQRSPDWKHENPDEGVAPVKHDLFCTKRWEHEIPYECG